jgi:hypothetical protein
MAVRRAAAVLALIFAGTWTAPAFAQAPPRERVAVTLGVTDQISSTTFSQSTTFEAYSETGSLTTSFSISQKPRFDIGGVVRAWRGFGVGVAVTSMSTSDPAQITGEIPHPINANQPRPLTGSVDASHRESAIHLQAVYWFQPSPRIDVLIGGGPSFMRVEQDFVSDVSYTQTFPYDTVTFTGATLTRENKNVIGANGGAEIGFRLASRLGVVGLVRYSSATASFPDTGASAVKVGGFEVGGGLHLTF